MGTLAFCPWLRIEGPHTLGSIEFIPYERNGLPGSPGSDLQQVFDSITEPYLAFDEHPIDHATLLKQNGRDLTVDLNQDEVEDLFFWIEIFAFAGLSCREYFLPGAEGYCNRDNFQLIVQRFDDPGGGVALTARRRDRNEITYVTRQAYRVRRPDHVRINIPIRIDTELLRSLISASSHHSWQNYWESIVGYNLANTDSASMTERLEVVLLVGAFERLLDCRRGVERDLINAFLNVLRPTREVAPAGCPPLSGTPGLRSQYATCTSVREVWMRDLFRVRGALAHGSTTIQYPSAWSLPNHLLLAGFIFPLVCKSSLIRDGFYTFSGKDRILIDAFESLACEEYFAPSPGGPGGSPWTRVLSDAMLRHLQGY